MTDQSPPSPCLFCGVRPAASAEHIVLCALGGRKVVRDFTCEPCNNNFGATIDQELEGTFRAVSLLVGAFRGDGRPVAPLPSTNHDTGESVTIQHGGKARPRYEATVTLHHDGGEEIRPLKSFNRETISQMTAALAARLGLVDEPFTASLSMIDPGPVNIALNEPFGGPEQFRAVTKMALAALAKGGSVARGARTRKCCRWIAEGSDGWPHALDPAAWPAVRQALGTSDGQHVLAVWPVAGRLEGTFLAFGFIPYRVRLPATTRSVEPFAHVVDPVTERHVVIKVAQPPDLRPIEEATLTQTGRDAVLQAYFDWVRQAAFAARLKGTVADAFEKLREQGLLHLEVEHAEQLARDITAALFPKGGVTELDATPLVERIRQLIAARGQS